MRLLVQRVSEAKVVIDGNIHSQIGGGFLVFLGIHKEDSQKDCKAFSEKLVNLRIFSDAEDKLNLSLKDVGGEILIVSQFSLYADCSKGRRPSFTESAPPAIAEPLYEHFLESTRHYWPHVQSGVFGADMKVHLVNEGPFTLLIE